MKNLILFVWLSLLSLAIQSQNQYGDIFTSKSVHFFGYDFTNFKLIETKRIGKDEKMKNFMLEVITLMNAKRDERVFAGYLKKDTVIFTQNIVNSLNASLKNEQLLGGELDLARHKIPKDSLQAMVNRYDTKGMSGIGFVEIMECFYKPKKETSIWYVFFDISTKKVLDSHEIFNRDADGYHGLASYWVVGVGTSMSFYFNDHYKKVRKTYLKHSK